MLRVVLLLPFFSLFLSCGKTDFDFVNKGVPGDNIADLHKRVQQDVLAFSPDWVIIMIGTNDCLNSKKFIAAEQFQQQLDHLIKRLQKNDLNIILVAPPTVDAAYLLERHDRKLYPVPPNDKLELYAQIIKQVATQHQLPFIDIFQQFKQLGVPQHNQDSLIQNEANSGVPDGVHPTAAGHKVIAQFIFDEISNNSSVPLEGKVICFGDSNTYGWNVEGAGSSEGQTWPAFLKAMLDGTAKN